MVRGQQEAWAEEEAKAGAEVVGRVQAATACAPTVERKLRTRGESPASSKNAQSAERSCVGNSLADRAVKNGKQPLQFVEAENLSHIETERRSPQMFTKVIAVPSMHPGGLDAVRSGHFGHCDAFTLVSVENGEIRDVSVVSNPPHQQGGCQAPVNLLQQSQADALIVGGIGMRPLMGFRQAGIDVYYGPEGDTVEAVIGDLLEGRLKVIQEHEVCGGGRI